jgi:hypothetical protein
MLTTPLKRFSIDVLFGLHDCNTFLHKIMHELCADVPILAIPEIQQLVASYI